MLPSGLVRVAADGLIVDANEVLVGWTGAAEVIGRPLASVLVPPGPSVPPDSPEGEYLPALAFVDHLDGSRMPVLVAEGPSDDDGCRHVILFDARAQREFRERMDRR